MIIEDADAYVDPNNVEHRWVYDRLLIAQTQTYACGEGECRLYQAVVKPRINLLGMARGATLERAPVRAPAAFMWSEDLVGRHVSTDALVEGGKLVWTAQALGFPSPTFGRFEMWTLGREYEPELDVVAAWVAQHLPAYSGPLNVETIGGQLIEVHLRLTADWQRAGCYDYVNQPRPAIGVPLHRRFDSALLPSSVSVDEIEDGGRCGFVVVRL